MNEMIGRLRVALGLETAAFEKGAKRATAEINTLGSTTEKAALKIGSMGKAVVATGGAFIASSLVSSLKNTVEQSLRSITAMKQLAQVSNASIAEFQGYAFAAGTVGVEMDKLADIYKDINDRVGEFLETGAGPMKDFFENIAPKVGVTAAQFKNLSGPQALQLYVSSLEKAGVNQQQMTFYLEAMSGDLTKLLPLLQNNGAGMRRLSDDARRMGIVLDENLVKNAGEASRTMDTLNTVLSMQITKAVAENAKEIAAFTTALTNFAISAIKAFNAWNQFNGAMDERDAAKRLSDRTIERKSKEMGWSPELKAAVKQSADASLDKSYGVAPVSSGDGWSWSNNPLWQLKRVKPKTKLAGGGIMPSAAGTFAAMASGSGRSIADLAWDNPDRLEAVQGIIAITAQETEKAADKVEVANERIARSFGEMSQDSLYALESLVSAVQGGGALNILRSVIGLGTTISGIVGGGNGMPSALSINKSTLASLRSTTLPSMPAYANGTRFHPGGLALVGERGPEIVRMPRGSSVIPNHAIGGTAIQVLPSKYFDVHVMQGVGAVAPMIANAGADLGVNRISKAGRRRLA